MSFSLDSHGDAHVSTCRFCNTLGKLRYKPDKQSLLKTVRLGRYRQIIETEKFEPLRCIGLKYRLILVAAIQHNIYYEI